MKLLAVSMRQKFLYRFFPLIVGLINDNLHSLLNSYIVIKSRYIPANRTKEMGVSQTLIVARFLSHNIHEVYPPPLNIRNGA